MAAAALQDFAQLVSKYDENEAKTIRSNCETWVYLKSNDNGTNEEISKRLGKYTTTSYSLSQNAAKYTAPSSGSSVQTAVPVIILEAVMKKEDIILPGENFEWHEESGTMLGNDYQQADAIIVMDNWISIFGGQLCQPNVRELTDALTLDILCFYQDVMKAFITMLRRVKLYPDCIAQECDYIFERAVTVDEFEEIYQQLCRLERRYNVLMFMGIDNSAGIDVSLQG